MLITSKILQEKVEEIASYINRDNEEELILVSVLKGSLYFTADLSRHIRLPMKIEYLSLRVQRNASSSASIKMERYSAEKRIYQDKTVLIVEDIIRSGITLHWLRDFFLDSMGVKRLMIATLLYVKGSRFPKNLLDYLGFEVDDEYYIGYGLDHLGKYRNFDFITTLHEAK